MRHKEMQTHFKSFNSLFIVPRNSFLISTSYLYSSAVRVQYRTCIALSGFDLCFLGLQLFRGDSLYRNHLVSMRYPYYLFFQRIGAIALQ